MDQSDFSFMRSGFNNVVDDDEEQKQQQLLASTLVQLMFDCSDNLVEIYQANFYYGNLLWN